MGFTGNPVRLREARHIGSEGSCGSGRREHGYRGHCPGIIMSVIRDGRTYALDSDMSEEDALAYWLSPDSGDLRGRG